MTWKKSTFLCCLGVFVITFLVFRGVLNNDFVNWDDPMFVTENPGIQSLDRNHIYLFFTTFEAGGYTPLSRLSLALDWALWGDDPRGFHLTALILHALNACLVFLIARKLYSLRLRKGLPPSFGGQVRTTDSSLTAYGLQLAALLAALLFSLHPLRVESVAWISERRDLLSGFFGLATVLFWMRFAGGQKTEDYLVSFLLFICAVLSKGALVTLPVVLALLSVYLSSNVERLPRRSLAEAGRASSFFPLLPFLLVSSIIGLNTLFAVQISDLAHSTQVVGWEPRMAQSLVANLFYLNHLFIPAFLNPLHALHSLYHFNQPIVWLGGLAGGGITLLLALYRKQCPAAWMAWWAWLIMIFPFLGIAESGLQLTADRYTYFSMIPFSLLAGGAFLSISKPAAWLMPTCGLLGFLWLTPNQILVWKDSETLWSYSLELDSQNLTAWLNLCDALEAKGKQADCIPLYREILCLDPNHVEIWNHLGVAFEEKGDFEKARAVYERALQKSPSHVGARHNLGRILLKTGKFSRGLFQLEMAWKQSPSPEMEADLERALEYVLRQPKLSKQDLEIGKKILAELKPQAKRGEMENRIVLLRKKWLEYPPR